MKIRIGDPDIPAPVVIDPDVQQVEITEAFNGIVIVTEDGERLAVCMRDSGFEVHHWGDHFDSGWFEFKEGTTSPGTLTELELT